MVSKRQKMKKSKNSKTVSALSVGRPFTVGVKRPPPYLRAHDDIVHAKFGCVLSAVNRTAGTANYLVILSTQTTNSNGYVGLGHLINGFSQYGAMYAKFMVGNLRAVVRCISPTTAGGFAIVNYEPDSSGTSNPPTVISDVSNANHKTTATPTTLGAFSVPVHEYFNDWKATLPDASGSSSTEYECGVMQVLGSNTGAVGDPSVLVELEFDAWFTGFRKL